jgi:hypothetical protein
LFFAVSSLRFCRFLLSWSYFFLCIASRTSAVVLSELWMMSGVVVFIVLSIFFRVINREVKTFKLRSTTFSGPKELR